MIRFACPTCKKVYKAPDEHAGRKTVCKKCDAVVIIPTQPVREMVYGVPLPPEPATDQTTAAPVEQESQTAPKNAPPSPPIARPFDFDEPEPVNRNRAAFDYRARRRRQQ